VANVAGLANFISKWRHGNRHSKTPIVAEQFRLWSAPLLNSARGFEQIASGIDIYSFYEDRLTSSIMVRPS
jgi:hypothetical protein